MSIIRLNPSQAVEYRSLMLEAYDRHPDAFTSSVGERERQPIKWWEDRLSAGALPKEVVFGNISDNELCGVAGVSFETREKVRHKATLFGMYVPERHRKQGMGRDLVQAALAYAKSRPGVLLMQLTVTDGNRAAQELYASGGFVSFGVEPYAVRVGNDYVSKVHMWRHL